MCRNATAAWHSWPQGWDTCRNKAPTLPPGSSSATCSRPPLLFADTYLKNDVLSIQESIVSHVEYTLARSRYNFDDLEAYLAAAHSLRDRLIEVWNDTQTFFREANPKRVYYLSMEFLMGRSLTNALYNLDVQGAYKEAIMELGYDLEKLASQVTHPCCVLCCAMTC